MPKKILHYLFATIACSLSLGAYAYDITDTNELILAKKCFIEQNGLTPAELAIDNHNDFVLFAVERQSWWQAINNIKHTQNCGKFINVNDEWNNYVSDKTLNTQSSNRVSSLDYDYFLQFLMNSDSDYNPNLKADNYNGPVKANKTTEKSDVIEKLYSLIDRTRIEESLDLLSAHYNRAAFSDDGYKAATHFKNTMKELAKKHGKSSEEFDVSYLATNMYYKQPSVIAVLGKDLPEDALVISAHMDTNGGGRRPGADDDGSGAMVVLEAARLILGSDVKLNRPVYFIFYAAEEMGLVGSKIVVREMQKRGTAIDSVLHFDTVGRRPVASDPTLYLLRDNVDQGFTDYITTLLNDYVKVPVDYTRCGYACSDHASWNRAGFSAAAGFESTFDNINPYLHTSGDTKEHVSFDNLVNFTKLAIAYIIDKAA